MRWPWETPKLNGEIDRARKDANDSLIELGIAIANREEVDELFNKAKKQQERNHFGEGVELAMKRRKK